LPANPELPQVLVEPAHGGLDDVVHPLERDRRGDLDLAPDQRIGVEKFDTHRGDLARVVVGRGHAASVAGPLAWFQGSSWSMSLWGWPWTMRVMTSAR
jgi:hypothetical protein